MSGNLPNEVILGFYVNVEICFGTNMKEIKKKPDEGERKNVLGFSFYSMTVNFLFSGL